MVMSNHPHGVVQGHQDQQHVPVLRDVRCLKAEKNGERVHVVDLGGPEQLRGPDLTSPLNFLGINTNMV